MSNLLAKAIAIAATAFENKVDKGGQPYILHCIRVMMKCKSEKAKIVAMLHDVPEDTDITVQDLDKMGFPLDVIIALTLLTHDSDEDYHEYIKHIAGNPLAREVKLADLEDNSNITRLKGLGKKDFDRMEKYHRSYVYLSRV